MSVPLPRVAEPDEPGDADLISSVRSGDLDAYGLLYRRHAGSALGLARQLTSSRAEADDLVAEAFAKVLDVLRTGGGPDTAFRAYLLTTLRNTLYDRARRDRRLELSGDMTRHDPGVPWEDTAVARLDSTLAARAFYTLPERWQTVLWHTEIEQESPAEVAPLLGLTPNGVAALAYRAREGLRQAYLQEHLANGVGAEHRATVNRLGAWARGGLSARQQARVDAHLAMCAQCRALASELEDVNAGMRAVIAPLVLGTAAAAAYLTSHSTPAAAAVAAAVHTAGAAGAAGAGGAGAAGAAGAGAAGAGAGAGAGAAGAGAGAAGAGAAGAGASAAGAGGAGAAHGAGFAGAGAAAAGGAVAGEAAGSGASALGSVTAWVAGTHAGQAAAAAVAAVVIGSTTVIATHDGGTSGPTPAAAATSTATAGLPGPAERAAATRAGDPTGSSATGPTPTSTATGSPGPTAGSASPGTSGERAAPTSRPGTVPDLPAPPPAGAATLLVGAPSAQGTLTVGLPGDIAIPVRNTGDDDVKDLVAVVRLSPGLTARPGSGGNGWDCTGSGTVATCTRDVLDGGDDTTLHVRVDVATPAQPSARINGTVRAGNGPARTIPSTRLTVLP